MKTTCSVCGKDSKDGWAIYRTSLKGEPFVGVCNEHRTATAFGAPDPKLADALRAILAEADGGWYRESPLAKQAIAVLAEWEAQS